MLSSVFIQQCKVRLYDHVAGGCLCNEPKDDITTRPELLMHTKC